MNEPRNPTNAYTVPSVSITTARTGASAKADVLGMREMQAQAYAKRGEQYLLIKSPPASGKSRALMFIALDKLHNQGLRQAIVVVPERSIGGSFADEPLSRHGFFCDWQVAPQWNLCNAPGVDEPRIARSKVDAVRRFLASADRALVCTHATFRFAVEELGVEVLDDRMIAIDEFHHVSSNPDNKLGSQLAALIARDKAHVVAMTGSYFRGDSAAVLSTTDEARFETVTYTYYQQLNGYRWLKSLDIGYFFYTGRYVDAIGKVLDPALKTIVHIPNVNSRESLQDKEREVNEIMNTLGEWKGIDAETGFHRVQTAAGRVLKVADLVDDGDSAKRSRVLAALKDPAQKGNRDHVDVVIALGMAKEGFDWIWCEHALTVGYRSSLTEIVQIIGRATRDAESKERARFTNLIAEPTAEQSAVAEAVNDMLKAISASLLMEQVLAPRYEFTPKNAGPREGFDYGEAGYRADGHNLGVNMDTGQVHVEINGLATPRTAEAARICREDLNEVVTSFLQDKTVLERGLFDKENTLPEELTQLRMGKIVRERYPELGDADQEAIRQHAIAAMNITQQAKLALAHADAAAASTGGGAASPGHTTLLDGVRKFVNVRDLDIDLIDRINPFDAAYAVLAKAMDEKSLRQVQASIAAKKVNIPEEEARELARRALQFKLERGRLPDINAADAWEKRMAEGVAALARHRAQARAARVPGMGSSAMAEMDDDELLDALGVEVAPLKAGNRTPREERIVAGFEDILRFHQAHGRVPRHGEGLDIFERLYAVRLDRLRQLPEARALLAGLDAPGLLAGDSAAASAAVESLDEDALLAALGIGTRETDGGQEPAAPNDISVLRHVRSTAAKRAVEDIAERTPCADFATFQPSFEQVERELKAGTRKSLRFGRDTSIADGNWFIVGGQLAYVAETGAVFKAPNGDSNARLRVIYANGMESNLLRRSLQRALYKDDTGRRLTDPDMGPLFGAAQEPDDIAAGTIYVLRSLSNHPFVAAHRDLIHKIGVTGGKVEARIAAAEKDATYLLADVEVVATYQLHNVNRTRLENIFHRLFGAAQLDLTIEDRFGRPVKPREWFLLPLPVIDEAVQCIRDGSVTDVVYDPAQARLVGVARTR